MPLRQPFSLVTKPNGAACNLECSYCFFLSKEVLADGGSQAMSETMLRTWLTNFLHAQPDGEVMVIWQGGEPTLRGLDFFARAVEVADGLARPTQQVRHVLQTNATLIDERWATFLAENDFLVGVSIDGPADLHDHHRVNRAGRGTHAQVVRGWRHLREHGVDVNILCTVNSTNADHPLDVYRHFRDDLGADFVQFIPIVERYEAGHESVAEAGWRDAHRRVLYTQSGDRVTSRTVRPEQWGRFMTAVFDEWLHHDVGRVFVQHFDVMLSAMFGQHPLCVHAPECGTALAMEHNGDVYACDHYVEPDHLLGNVTEDSLGDLLALPQQREFGRAKRTALPRQCLACPVRWACHGGCPKDRLATTADGEPGLNHLCAGYYAFFTHAWPAMSRMADLLREGRAPADIMQELDS